MIAAVTDLGTCGAIERFDEAAERKDIEAPRAAITADCVFESPALPSGNEPRWLSRHSCRPVFDKGSQE